jgi:hypothetical protein
LLCNGIFCREVGRFDTSYRQLTINIILFGQTKKRIESSTLKTLGGNVEYTFTKIENTREARKAPPKQYRLLCAGHDDERNLYHVQDFDRAELALNAADELLRSKDIHGWGIVHDANGRILTLDDGPSQMYTYADLLKTYGGDRRRESDRAFTPEHAKAIEALQPERLPGWQKGDQMLVFWDDIAKATGAHARPGDF